MLLTSYRVTPAVYRLRAGTTTDSYGDPVEDWSNPERTPLPGASVQFVEAVEEDGVIRYIRQDERVLFAPGAPEITREDRIEVDGEIWRVHGTPNYRRGLASTAFVTVALTQANSGGS
jgi:hypothetical protein